MFGTWLHRQDRFLRKPVGIIRHAVLSWCFQRKGDRSLQLRNKLEENTYRNGALSSGKAREGHNSDSRESHDELIFDERLFWSWG